MSFSGFLLFGCRGDVLSVLYSSTCLTPGSVEPREAAAGKGPQTVEAAGAVHTGVRVTLVYVHLTQSASVALHALTPETRRERKTHKKSCSLSPLPVKTLHLQHLTFTYNISVCNKDWCAGSSFSQYNFILFTCNCLQHLCRSLRVNKEHCNNHQRWSHSDPPRIPLHSYSWNLLSGPHTHLHSDTDWTGTRWFPVHNETLRKWRKDISEDYPGWLPYRWFKGSMSSHEHDSF